jgi:hypothetical protein
MPSKPKRRRLADESERFKLYHYEPIEGDEQTGLRSNVFGHEEWRKLVPPPQNYAAAKRRAFELVLLHYLSHRSVRPKYGYGGG